MHLLSTLRRIDRKLFDPFRRYPELLDEAIGECTSLLDVGCGSGSPIQYLPRRFKHTVGVDGFQPSLDRVRALGCHHELRKADLLDIGSAFPPKSFDVVVALDVIEHFEKPDGLRLLQMMEELARKRVVIFTPNGFLPQGVWDNNPHQIHRSGWTVKEMCKLGYRVIGLGGWKPLRKEFGEIRFRPFGVWLRISLATQPLVERIPVHAFQILCVKSLDSAA
jgi:SAM-dependent methyltransferase